MTVGQVTKFTRKTLAGFMAVWLSGVLFLFCCEKINGKPMQAEICPLAKVSEHCDKAAKANADSSIIGLTESDCADCCGFLPAIFDKNRKIEREQKQIALATKTTALKFRVPLLTDNSPQVAAFYSRVPDRQGTFIKNCTFRI